MPDAAGRRRASTTIGFENLEWENAMRTQLRQTALLAALMLASSQVARATDGFYDTTWQTTGNTLYDFASDGHGSFGNSIAAQPDGKLIIAGDCPRLSGGPSGICVARLLPNGNADYAFGDDQHGYNVLGSHAFFDGNQQIAPHGLALQTDGRVVLASTGVVPYSLRNEGRLIRLAANGQFEPLADGAYYRSLRFQEVDASVADTVVSAVAIAPDGKFVVAGTNHYYDTSGGAYFDWDMGVARFNADMTPDTSFDTRGYRSVFFDQGGDKRDVANAVAVQSDGKIVLAGVARSADGSGNNDAAVARVNVDGSMDTTFGNGGRATLQPITPPFATGPIVVNSVNAVAIDRRGGILIAGSMIRNDQDGVPLAMFVARFQPDGQLDRSFGNFFSSVGLVGGFAIIDYRGTYPYKNEVFGLLLHPNGEILAYGVATTDQASPPASNWVIGRLAPTGLTDSSFGYSQSGFNFGAYSSPVALPASNDARDAVIADGGLFIIGRAFTYLGTEHFGVAKLTLNAIVKDGFDSQP